MCRKLSEGLCQVVEDFNLVKFVPLAIQVGAKEQRYNAGKQRGDSQPRPSRRSCLSGKSRAFSPTSPCDRSLCPQDPKALAQILDISDKANGYVFARLATDKSPVPPEFMYGATTKVGCASGAAAEGSPHASFLLLKSFLCVSIPPVVQGTEGDLWMDYQERFIDGPIRERQPATEGPTMNLSSEGGARSLKGGAS